MLTLALFQIVAVQVLVLNPLWNTYPVGVWPVLNILTLAYLLPAVLLLAARRSALCRLPVRPVMFDAIVLLLLLTFATLSVRQLFKGDVISLSAAGLPSDWEMYCYSGVGLSAALLLILLGIRTNRVDIRNTAVIILLLTVAKVFRVDMSDLSGVPRILSFMGLGFSLIGVGWIYQRFVFMRPSAQSHTDTDGH